MQLNQVITTLRGEKEYLHQQFKAEVKGVFGSYSRNEQRADSDIDLLVRFEKGATLVTLAGLINYLKEKLGTNVDVLSERAIRKELQEAIEKDLVRI
jgi:predicted nucleotidyltransferase